MHSTGYWLQARLEFLVKQPLEGTGTRAPRALFSFVSQLPRSLLPPASGQQPANPAPDMGRCLVWATSSTPERPARVRGLVLKRTATGNFFVFSFCAKPRTGKCCQRPSHQRSERPNVMPSRSRHTAQSYIYSSYSHIVSPSLLLPPPKFIPNSSPSSPRCAGQESRAAVLTILRLARLCLVYGRPYSSCGPQGSNYVSFLSAHNQPSLAACLGSDGQAQVPLGPQL